MSGAGCGARFRDADGLARDKFAAKCGGLPMVGRILSRTLSTLVLILCSSSRAMAETLPSIEVVRAAYAQSVSSIWTLDCRDRVSSGHADGTHDCGW